MNPSLCMLSRLSYQLISIYIGILLVYALVSWLPGLRGKWTEYVEMLVNPLLLPLRRVIPVLGGFDLSFLVLVLLLELAQNVIRSSSVCITIG